MDRFNLSAKDIKPGMMDVNEVNVYWWAYLYWREQLNTFEDALRNTDDKDMISCFRYCVVEAKKILIELYQKLIQICGDDGWISKPEWMDEFLNTN